MSDWWSADPVVNSPTGGLQPAHRDLAIRTIYGEAANEPENGQAAVVAVIKNRMDAGRYGGNSIPGVVLAKNQFEPWGNNDARSRMMALQPNDPRYQKIGSIVDQVFGGQMDDPTGGATHFVAPAAQAALGRAMPSWAQGEGRPIGRHTFFAPEGRVQQASNNWWSNDAVVQPDSPARFSAPPEGGNFRTAREGMSEPTPGLMDKLAQAWDKPAAGGLMSMVKPIAQGVNTLMKAGHGDIPMTGADGRTNPDVIDASWEAAKGLTPASRSPEGWMGIQVGKGLPVRQAPQEAITPTLAQHKTAATDLYKGPAVKELEVKPQPIAEYAQATKAKLTEEGFGETEATGVWANLSKLEKAPDGSVVTGQNLHSLRKTFGRAANERQADGTPTSNAAAAMMAQRELDAFIPSLAAKDVVAGNPQAAAAAWREANANYAAYKSARSIDQTVIKAENRAASTNSGQNVANTVRQRLATVMNDDKQFSRFNPEQQAMIREIVHGRPSENAVRFVGKLLGGGGGLGMVAAGFAGGMATGGPGAALPLAGFALNALSNRMTLTQAAKLSEAIRQNSPLANAMNDFAKKAVEYHTMQNPKTVSGAMIAARNLSNNMRDASIYLSPADIMRALQSPMKSAAEDNQ